MDHDLDSKESPHETKDEVVDEKGGLDNVVYAEDAKIDEYRGGAIEAENEEHNMTVIQAVKAYPMASFWAFMMSFTIIMESYDVFLCNNFVALPAFKQRFGVFNVAKNEWIVQTKWQQALQASGQLGALIGVMIAGPITSRIGYRWTTLIGLMSLNAFIFCFFFAETLPIIFLAQILEGLPWGLFIANAPAYCSEIVPIKLRAPCTQMLQMFWAIGSIIVGAVTFVYNTKDTKDAYKIPIALQWMFPTPLFLIFWFAPESPWWLVRHGRHEEAARSVERLGRKSRVQTADTIAMMRRVVELEKSAKAPNHIELFRGTDRYRTLIVCGVYAAQNLTGNLIANQAVYFFQQAGMSDNTAFALGLITSALQMIFVMLSWILTTYFGRRAIYLWGSFVNFILLVALGVAASVPGGTSTNGGKRAQASLGLIVSVLFTLGPAPASWVIIGETSAIRLRPLTTGMGRATYYIVEIPCIFLASWMLNPTGGNLAGRCGYVWGATALVCLIAAYIWLPEMKGRSYREIDILFNRKVPARKWPQTKIDVQDDH